MKVLLDTNVLVSAVATRGLCADILRLVLASHELVTTDQVLEELDRALRTKFRVPETTRKHVIQLLRDDVISVAPTTPLEVDIKDKTDIALQQSALAAEAKIIVTGDKEILGLKRIGKLSILSPRAFWEKVKADPGD